MIHRGQPRPLAERSTRAAAQAGGVCASAFSRFISQATVLTASVLIASPGLAQEETSQAQKVECAAAYEQSQRSRKEGDLMEAQSQAIICAQSHCPAVLSEGCTGWVSELEEAVPTHVFELLEADGQIVAGAELSIDGGPFVKNSGTAQPLNPGNHTVVFRTPDGRRVESTFASTQGRTGIAVRATLPARAPEAALEEASVGSSVPAGTWVLGGVGMAGIATFAVLGSLGKAEQNSLPCSEAQTCDREDGKKAQNLYLAADISLYVGLAAVAGAATWWLVAPRETGEGSALAVWPQIGGGTLRYQYSF